MKKNNELTPEQLRYICDESIFDFESTADIPELSEIIGQERAVEAIEFGMEIDSDGFNIFAIGPSGAGKTSTIQRFVQRKAKEKPVPEDWCYVYNFDEEHKPKALRLLPGKGREFRQDMENLVTEVKQDIVQAFEREEYEKEKASIMESFQKMQGDMFSQFNEKAESEGFSLQRGPTGFFVVPMHEGSPITGKEYQKLSKSQREKLEETGNRLQQELGKLIRDVQDLERDVRQKLKELERNTVLFAAEHHIDRVKTKYKDHEGVADYLDNVREDIVINAGSIVGSEKVQEDQSSPFSGIFSKKQEAVMERYRVNLIVDNSSTEGAPVIVETDPTFQNLIGKLERQAMFGMLVTDFNMIKPGALHRANGGYLIVEADHLMRNPFSYQALKHALKDKEIKLSDVSEMFSMVSAAGLEPDPIPLDVKVILIGNPMMYYLLYDLDEEFKELFKIKADFNVYMERNEENTKLYAHFLASQCSCEGWRHFNKGGIGRMVEYGSELLGDQTKLSTKFADICDLVREANFWARKSGSDFIRREDVQKAIDSRNRRNNRIEEVLQEMIERGDIFIDVEGDEVGQVNGLSVMSLGDYMFGKPSRITARTYVGRGGVINIDREVKMSGPIHNKGVLILSGYLNGKYGKEKPISLSASIVFEQLYEGVEGDSASSTELYALLSSLSGYPIKQGFAVTGSVNQQGEVQPIGGATQKIEGFFDVCKAKGFTGEQGVLIPKTNVKNLMLREDIIKAVKDGRFHIYPVETIDQGVEILTGIAAGELKDDGTYPEGTLNHAVDRRLTEFAECWKEFRAGVEERKRNDGQTK
ncbi:MAG: AAA family ATPase [Spirochaetota bacterium]|nr:MAG: AAA family ATPase [Spirochaetota bacterium]